MVKKSIFSKIFGVGIAILSISSLLLLILVVLIPIFLGGTRYLVVSDSMSPTINRGDVIISRETDTPEVGQIVTFVQDGELLTHRITRIVQGEIYTQGDANMAEDFEPISAENILGVVVYKIPFIGKLFLK